MKLYELSNDFSTMFEDFDAIYEWEPDTDEDGNPIDDDGNIIEDVARYKQMLVDAWFDTLQGIEEMFEQKVENIAVYIKTQLSEAEQLKAEAKRLTDRARRKNKKAESLESYIFNEMKAIGREKVDMPKAFVRIKTNPESAIIDNEKMFIEWAQKSGRDDLLKYEAPKPKKIEIKKLIKDGIEVPFAHTERSQKLEIK